MMREVTWRKKNVAATKDINGRDDDISINETEVVFNQYLVYENKSGTKTMKDTGVQT